jgi:uracil-DNA glycosylase
MFRWFENCAGISEAKFRATVYMAAVCRCFPGKNQQGGDRVPSQEEIGNCSAWMRREFELLRPQLVIAVGKLAIGQFLRPLPPLSRVIGQIIRAEKWGHSFDLAPLPHPSGASPWHRTEPGKELTERAVELICQHPAWIERV